MLKFPLSMLLAVVGVLAAAAPSVHAQISPQPRGLVDSTVMLEDPPADSGHTSTLTTSFTSGTGVNSVSVTYKNETTGETFEREHSFEGAHSGTYVDQLTNTKAGDKIKMTKVYEMSDGTTITKTSHGTIG